MNATLPNAYAFQIDDNSFFFRELVRAKAKSLFDCHYLALLRDWHRRFGLRVTLNCFLETPDGFSLDQFPDRYRDEWNAQADWLRLTFHAHREMPDYPYRNDTRGEAFAHDQARVKAAILRFAGEALWVPPSIVHWVAIPRTAWPTLARLGVRSLGGLFAEANPEDLKFNLTGAEKEAVLRHGRYRDPDTGITLFDVGIICNNTPPDRAAATLDAWAARCPDAPLAAIWTHEQYFWPFYRRYLPDHPARVERALEWAAARRLEPVFLHDYAWPG